MYLYINNFRGFKDTIIPIKDVNFLVGENSTGKTSILKLIKLLSNRSRENPLDFGSVDINFHLFSDLQNENQRRHQTIEIGVLFSDDNNINISGLLYKVCSKNNLTSLKSIRYVSLHSQFYCEIDYTDTGEIKERHMFLTPNYSIGLDFFKRNDLGHIEFNNNLNFNQSFDPQIPISTIVSILYHNALISAKKPPKFIGSIPTISDIILSAPIRSEPKRTYDNYLPTFKSDGSHIPYILRELLSKKNKDSKKFLEYLNSFGKSSGLYDEILVKEYSTENTAPFEIDVVLNGMPINLINVGYGVSQVLPILVEILTSKKSLLFAIQQPEIHLHPKGQAAMGEFFYNSWHSESKHFFIETHSDYLIDRFRISMNRHKRYYKKQADKCQVLFFNKTAKGNTVTPIAIEADGKYTTEKPKEFRDFFVKEELDILSLYMD